MISKEKQEQYKKKFNGTNRIIFIADESREEAFHSALPHFLPARDGIYIGPNNNIWKMIVASDAAIGKHVVEAIVDSSIDEKLFEEAILPACELRCIRIEFFN